LFLPQQCSIEIATARDFSILIIDSRGGWQLAGPDKLRMGGIHYQANARRRDGATI
jgi:hypothetical protein